MVSHELEIDVQIQSDRKEFLIPLLSHDISQLEFNQVELAFEIYFTDSPYFITHPNVAIHQLSTLEFGNDTDLIFLEALFSNYGIQEIDIIFGCLLIQWRQQLV
jgi:hypothetical protein